MQPLCDGLAVTGSRHGLVVNPAARRCGIVRYDAWEKLPILHLRAGVRIAGREYVFPLCQEGEVFGFIDQRTSPCTLSFSGIDPASRVKVKLAVAVPFRPRDADYSTTPVIALRLSVEKMQGGFRWVQQSVQAEEVEAFVTFSGPALRTEAVGGRGVVLRFDSISRHTPPGKPAWGKDVEVRSDVLPQEDLLVSPDGEMQENGFRRRIRLSEGGSLQVLWCSWQKPELAVQQQTCPFLYASRFAHVDAVAAHALAEPESLWENARNVDGIIAANNCGNAINRLLAYTLHSWMINTWWVRRPDGRDWFSVWEGSCYFHSTVDVEFTQAPFYLALWPELLGIELDFWPEYSKDGTLVLGKRGAGTRFLSHDTGWCSSAHNQGYPHEMEVEETANYLILLCAHWRRTGDDRILRRRASFIQPYLAFIYGCDSSGAGIPDVGVANTVDDASPAVQFGRKQIYLAVKVLAALKASELMLTHLGEEKAARKCRRNAAKIRRTVTQKGWAGEHFVTLLQKDGMLRDPWTGTERHYEEIPGWDCAHIYTANALPPLDMVGVDTGLDRRKLTQDLRRATELCLREYGCVHSSYAGDPDPDKKAVLGLAGSSTNSGWISMNMSRDMAAFYRGVDLRSLSERYWEWQTTVNSREAAMFFETFSGNNLCFYPRGVAVWGYFDALAGRVLDAVRGCDETRQPFKGVCVPDLFHADWQTGTAPKLG